LAAVQRKFAGQAEAYGKTTAGSLDRAGVASENLGEIVGTKLTPLVAKGATALVGLIDKSGGLAGPVRSASGAVKDAYGAMVGAVRNFARNNREDIDAVVKAVRTLGRFVKNIFEDVLIPVFKRLLPVIKGVVEGILLQLRGLIRIVTGIITGDWKRVWDGAKDIVTGLLKRVKAVFIDLPLAILDGLGEVGKAGARIGGRIVGSIMRGIGNLGHKLLNKITGAFGWVKDKLGDVGGFFSGIGKGIAGAVNDGVGKPGGPLALPQGGAFGGNLYGARPEMRPIAALGARFGLQVTSGRTNHSKYTKSGNLSFHGTGEAIDVSNSTGPTPQMMAFFKFMERTLGPRLAELIYTPAGYSIDHGRRVSPIAAADHFNHVHVAMDLGRPGIGDGRGRKGDGIGQIARAASRYWRGNDLVTAVAVAGPESGYINRRRNYNPPTEDSRGPWQVNVLAHPWARGMNLYDPNVAASAAHRVWARAGRSWTPWAGFTGPDGRGSDGPWRSFVGRARAAVAALSGGGRAAGGGAPAARNVAVAVGTDLGVNTGLGGPVRGGPNTGVKRDVLPSAVPVKMPTLFGPSWRTRSPVNKLGSAFMPSWSKGRGALPAGVEAPSQAQNDLPSVWDFLSRDLARAELTEDLSDDLAVLRRQQEQARADVARTTGLDPRLESAALQQLKSVTDAVKSLEETITQADERRRQEEEARQSHTDALKAVADALNAQTKFAERVQATENFQMKKWIADVISGQVGATAQRRGLTPGSGSAWAY
jgi:hypothetical protein